MNRVPPAKPTSECVLWTGPFTNGYPRRGRTLVHREVLAKKLGRPLAPRMDACHTCDVRACTNPDHLYEGSRRQNMADCRARGRLNKPRGDEHPCTRVTDDQIREMRALVHDNGWTGTDLSRKYGLHPRYAIALVRGTAPRKVPA